jgi:ankyrin repeat protein
MFNRLNRNVSFALCLGGMALIAVGCADTDDARVAATASSEARASAQQGDEVRAAAVVDQPEKAAEDAGGTPDIVQAAASPQTLAPTQDASSQQRDEAAPAPAPAAPVQERAARGEESGELLFSPSRSFDEIVANLPEHDRQRNIDLSQMEPRVEVTPALLDLGTMGTSQTKSGIMTLRNISDEPVMIENSRTSCGCTVANVPRGQYLQPGESVDVEVSLRSSTRDQVLTKTVTFLIKDHAPVTARVRGEVVSFVTIEPAVLSPGTYQDAKLVIKANDNTPFRVTSLHPQIVAEELREEPAASHEFTIAWDKWVEFGEARRVIFYIDHPEVSQVMATIRAPQRRPDDAATRQPTTTRDPARPNPFALVLRGQTEQLLELIKEGEVDLAARDRTGQTLLALAAQIGNVQIVDAMIETGLDVNTRDTAGRTPLMNAGQAKHPDVVKRLIEAGADLDVTDSTIGGTALAWTVAFGDPVSAKHLIDAGADVNIPTEATGFTPLIWAAGFGQTTSVKHLVEAGAKLEATDRIEGATALMHATRTGRIENIKALIAAGANIEAKDKDGKTPLIWAAGASGASVQTVQALVEAGAKLDARDNAGLGVLDHARGRNDPHAAAVVAYLASLLGEEAN